MQVGSLRTVAVNRRSNDDVPSRTGTTAISRGDGIGLAFHTDAGKRVIAPEPRKSGIGDPSIGDRVRIRYDPRHPTDVVLDVDSTARDITLWIVALKLLLGGAVLLVAGLWRLRRARHATGG